MGRMGENLRNLLGKRKRMDYKEKLAQEIKHYDVLYESEEAKQKLAYETPAIWTNVDIHVFKKVSRVTGTNGMIGYISDFCNQLHSKATILTLGGGPCNLEINQLSPSLEGEYEIVAVDINETTCLAARARAEEKGIPFTYILQDINQLSLERESYDVIIAFASLHHFLNLDHITKECNKALKKGGIFVTLDIPTRNGYRLWDETKVVINAMMRTLPEEFRLNYWTKKIDEEYVDNDLSASSFECVNSERIIPCLRNNLTEVVFVPTLCIARRFFDHTYGFNFDKYPNFGSAFQQFILELDEYYLERNLLKPETFFGVYKKKC
jgi:ubiquinone/menaquinone biosynthesis C-methylase UbiE